MLNDSPMNSSIFDCTYLRCDSIFRRGNPLCSSQLLNTSEHLQDIVSLCIASPTKSKSPTTGRHAAPKLCNGLNLVQTSASYKSPFSGQFCIVRKRSSEVCSFMSQTSVRWYVLFIKTRYLKRTQCLSQWLFSAITRYFFGFGITFRLRLSGYRTHSADVINNLKHAGQHHPTDFPDLDFKRFHNGAMSCISYARPGTRLLAP